MSLALDHPEATIRIEPRDAALAIAVTPTDGRFVPRREWVTEYPLELVEHVLRVKGPAYLCDEIMRDEDPHYVQHSLHWDMLSYVRPEDFAGRRVLDFGSGAGASSMVLARLFPESRIVGVELVPDLVELARHRARFHGVDDRVNFLVSPAGSSLPAGIGEFDYILFSAVYEHLLPLEREVVLPLLWAHLKPGGVLFLDQTPYRWFPVELHTTGLPFINYLPDRLALHCTRRFSRRTRADASWEELLRAGIRGGTTGKVMATLNREGGGARLLEPSHLGVKDGIDLWYRLSSTTRQAPVKTLMMWCFRAVNRLTGVMMVPALSLAIRKAGEAE